MSKPAAPEKSLQELLHRIEAFEAAASVADTGTGSRREGAGFERMLGELWEAVRKLGVARGATCTFVQGAAHRRWARLVKADRALYLPNNPTAPLTEPDAQPRRWLETVFTVSELVAAFPTTAEAVGRYSPDTGEFAGERYPELYARLTTKFDDTIVLEAGDVLREKILLEYKTAKSSGGRQIDGNAHERLSFQIMQYLEVATRYTRCSLFVLANGAFVKYRNKYHVNFHVQADRLANFGWFTMEHASTVNEYALFIDGLLDWLLKGRDRHTGAVK